MNEQKIKAKEEAEHSVAIEIARFYQGDLQTIAGVVSDGPQNVVTVTKWNADLHTWEDYTVTVMKS